MMQKESVVHISAESTESFTIVERMRISSKRTNGQEKMFQTPSYCMVEYCEQMEKGVRVLACGRMNVFWAGSLLCFFSEVIF